MDSQDQKEAKENQEQQDRQDHPDLLELWALLGQSDRKVIAELLGMRVHEERQVHSDHQDPGAR
jgi:hypothetical protein